LFRTKDPMPDFWVMKQIPLLLICCCLLFAGCRGGYRPFHIYFWSALNENYHLVINHMDLGELPHVSPDSAFFRKRALHRRLPSGHYTIELADTSGHIVYSEHLTILWRPGSLSISNGSRDIHTGSTIVRTGDDFIEGFHKKNAE
jgi:hypothetical protein